jgi:NADH:ubiquinone oxidoreductase subunit F (NADH-binding)
VDTRPALALKTAGADPLRGPAALLDEPVRFPVASLGDPAPAASLADHVSTYGPRPTPLELGPEDLTDAVADTGLTGRGGGHFPAATKWRTVREAARRTGQRPIVVANAAEGEPASAKDAALLCTRPHLVLDGLALAAEAVGAAESVVWLHGGGHEMHRALLHAQHERRSRGMVEPPVRLVTGPSHYLAGESSAVVRALSGGAALPESRREPSAVRGIDGRPTLVHNVETLARVGLLARTGVEGHRPTALVTVLAAGQRTVLEVEQGLRVGAVALLGGLAVDDDPQAVLIGGYGGSWLPWDRAKDLTWDEPTLRAAGVSMGAGVLALLPREVCGVAEVARVAAYLDRSGARQCGPCLFGLAAISATLADLRHGTGRRNDVRRLQQRAAEVTGRGACHHPDGAVRMALTGLSTFAVDVDSHRKGRPCDGADRPGVLPVPREAG